MERFDNGMSEWQKQENTASGANSLQSQRFQTDFAAVVGDISPKLKRAARCEFI